MVDQPALQARWDIRPNNLWKQCVRDNHAKVFVCLLHFQTLRLDARLLRHFIPSFIRNQFIHRGFLLGFRPTARTISMVPNSVRNFASMHALWNPTCCIIPGSLARTLSGIVPNPSSSWMPR